MNQQTAHELLDRFNEIERGKQMGENPNDALTIAYMMGAESANDKIRALKKRIEELEAQVEEYKKDNSELFGELLKWKGGEYRP